jgi:hypothetical protein
MSINGVSTLISRLKTLEVDFKAIRASKSSVSFFSSFYEKKRHIFLKISELNGNFTIGKRGKYRRPLFLTKFNMKEHWPDNQHVAPGGAALGSAGVFVRVFFFWKTLK